MAVQGHDGSESRPEGRRVDLQDVEANRGCSAAEKHQARLSTHTLKFSYRRMSERNKNTAGAKNQHGQVRQVGSAQLVMHLAAGNTGVESLVLVLGHALTALAKIDRALASVLCAASSGSSSSIGGAAAAA